MPSSAATDSTNRCPFNCSSICAISHRGDLGESLRFHRPVIELLVERLPTTVELGAYALLFAISVGVPLGVLSAYRHKSALDVGTMIGANIGVSMPVFWLGLMLAYLFAVLLKDTPFALPPSGRLTPGSAPVPFFPRTWSGRGRRGARSAF